MKILAEEDGQSTILVAIFLAIIFCGIAGLALDSGLLFRERRIVQAAADAAAIAASAQYGTTSPQVAALAAAKQQGGIKAATVSVPTPTVVNAATSDIKVVVTQPTKTIFMGAFKSSFKTINVSASAEASKPPPTSCATALSPGGVAAGSYPVSGCSGTGGILAGNSGYPNPQLQTTNCSICANSAVIGFANGTGIGTNQTINAGGGVRGKYTATGGTSAAGNCANPYAGLPQPTYTPCTCGSTGTGTGCKAVPWAGNPNGGISGQILVANPTGPPYCNFTDSQLGNLKFSGGTYLFTGTFSLNYAPVTSTAGTTLIFLPGSNLNGNSGNYGFANGMNMQISAPTSGTYAGIAIWDDSGTLAAPDTMTFNGGSSTSINGAIYAPYTIVADGNGSGVATVGGSVIAWAIELGGSGGLNITQAAGGGGSPGRVTLVK